MFGIAAALLSQVLFSIVVLLYKRLRQAGSSPLSALALHGFLIPLYLGMWFFFGGAHLFQSSARYFFYVLAWLIPVFAYNVGNTYLVRFQGLLELNAYKLGFATTIAILTDLFFLHTPYNTLTVVSLVCFFMGGYLITSKHIYSGLPLPFALSIIFGLSLLEVLEYAIYKKAMLLQHQILLHVAVAQVLLSVAFLVAGYKPLISDIKRRVIKTWYVAAFVCLLFPFVILETIALNQLPVVVVVLSSLLPLLIYSTYDVRTGEIRLTPQTAFAIIVVVLGSVLLSR